MKNSYPVFRNLQATLGSPGLSPLFHCVLSLLLAALSLFLLPPWGGQRGAAQPSLQWAHSAGRTGLDYGNFIATDQAGNVYITGQFQDTVDFNPDSTGTTILNSSGLFDIYFAKYDAGGNFLWAKGIGNTGPDESYAVATDASGNVYITGAFSGTLDFDPDTPATANFTAAGSADFYFAKYGPAGNYLWAKIVGGLYLDRSYCIAIDDAGNIYLTGNYRDSVDFDPGPGVAKLPPAGNDDIFIAKYDPDGNYMWAKGMGGLQGDYGQYLSLDDSGNVYVTGTFSSVAEFDPGPDTALLTSAGGADIFFAKFDSSGNYLWAKGIGSTGPDQSYSIAVDTLQNVYLTGNFLSTADFDPGSGSATILTMGGNDIFFAKYDPDGNYLWAKGIGSASTDVGRSIAVTPAGDIFLSGYFNGTADFDPGPGSLTLSYSGLSDIFLARYDTDGNLQWAKSMGSAGSERGNLVSLDSAGYIYLTGNFQNSVDFDPMGGVTNLTSLGNTDLFFAKYFDCGGFDDSTSQTNVTCFGDSNGIAAVYPVLGVPPFSYQWVTGDSTQTVSGLTAGYYIYGITDSVGCFVYDTVFIAQPSLFSISDSVTGVTCNGGSDGAINISVSDGSGVFGILWSTGDSTGYISGLAMGNYSVTVTDTLCTDTIISTISVNEPDTLNAVFAITDALCFGDSNGTVDLILTGGSPYLTFLWPDSSTTEDVTGLPAGIFFVTITDTVCADTVALSDTIGEPSLLSLTFDSVKNVTCNGGTDGAAYITVNGGTPGYTYLWSCGCPTEDVENRNAAVYSVTITDGNGCTLADSTTITEPFVISVLIDSVENVICNGDNTGFILITPGGGIGNFSFSWSNLDSVEDVSGLSADAYSVTITDSAGCTAVSTPVFVTESAMLNEVSTVFDVSCNGMSDGAIDVTVTGGSGSNKFLWNTGAVSEDIYLLDSGTYSVTITDTLCYDTIYFAATITEPPAITITPDTIGDVACNGDSTGFILISTGGGVGGLTYFWNNGDNTEDITNLVAGTYSITITDSTACAAIDSFTVTEPLFSVIANPSATNVSCFGLCDGTVQASAGGGTPPYTYIWSGIPPCMAASCTGLCPGTYTITLTDSNGCSFSGITIISEPSLLQVDSITSTKASCADSTCQDGSASVYASGGTGTLTYAWSNGGSTSIISNLTSNWYYVTVTDGNGCSESDSVFVDFLVFQSAIFIPITIGTQSAILIYPNPAKDYLIIQLIGTGSDIEEILLLNVIGQEVKRTLTGFNQLYIGDLPEGIYRLQIFSAGGESGINVVVRK
ncbi:MAG: T9SS type A sorting domain-containing protein [Bacteroidetes bacterium]|nr:T9SS type A sorting domain-containing protein [Bacteroidota bacterium]